MAENDTQSNATPNATQDVERIVAPLGGTRAEAMQRLQIGISGLAAMVLLVGLANIIQDRARQTDAESVPQATPTTEPVQTAPQSDPLADAGVVPDLPTETTTSPALDPALVPEQGDDVQAR